MDVQVEQTDFNIINKLTVSAIKIVSVAVAKFNVLQKFRFIQSSQFIIEVGIFKSVFFPDTLWELRELINSILDSR